MLRMVAILGPLLLCTYIAAGQEQQGTDTPATVSYFERLEYPYRADLVHIRGAVVIRAKLDNAGNVTSASVLAGHPLLASEAVSNIRKWRFKPNVSKEVVMVYAFRIPDNNFCDGSTIVSDFTFEPPNLVTVTACGIMLNPQTTGSQ